MEGRIQERDQIQHEGIDHEHKEAQGNQDRRERQYHDQRTNQRVDDGKNQGRYNQDAHLVAVANAGQQSGRGPQTEKVDEPTEHKRAYHDALHFSISLPPPLA